MMTHRYYSMSNYHLVLGIGMLPSPNFLLRSRLSFWSSSSSRKMPPRNRQLIPTDRSSTDRAVRPCELAYEGFREGSAREFPSSSEYFAPSFFHERVLPERMGLLPSAREARPLAVPLNLGTGQDVLRFLRHWAHQGSLPRRCHPLLGELIGVFPEVMTIWS